MIKSEKETDTHEFVDLYIDYTRMKTKLLEKQKVIESMGVSIEEFEKTLERELSPGDLSIFRQFAEGKTLKQIAISIGETHPYTRKKYIAIKHKVKLISKILIKYDI